MSNWEANSLVGQTLGQFEIKGELGRGGMAVVYKGYQASLDRWVAIKTLPSEFAGKREMVSRFHREAEAMVTLNHTNIVQIIDKGQDKGLYFFAMEFVEGTPLDQMLKAEERSLEQMFDIAMQVADGLAYAHAKGIVHRDIKPANVLFEQSTSLAKIADFGIARFTQKPEEMITLTATNVGMGTMNYMAPEQKTSAASVDHRADIFALGVMIYEMFTGKLPMGRFKMPSQLNPSLPKKLDEIVTRAMEPDPEDRYADMALLKADLEVARQGSGGGTLLKSLRDAADRTLTAVGGGESGSKLLPLCCLTFVLLGAGGAGAAYWWQTQQEKGVGKTGEVASGKKTGEGSKTGGGSKTEAGSKTETSKTESSKTGSSDGGSKTGSSDGGSKTKTGSSDGGAKTGSSDGGSKTKTGGSKTGASNGGSKTKTGASNGGSKTDASNGGSKTGATSGTPKVEGLSNPVKREIGEESRKLQRSLDDIERIAGKWGLKSLTRSLDDARRAVARARKSPNEGTPDRLRDKTRRLKKAASNALRINYQNLSRAAQQQRLTAALQRAQQASDEADSHDMADRVSYYDRAVRELAGALLVRSRAEARATLAAAHLRLERGQLAAGTAKMAAAKRAQQSGQPLQARLHYLAAQKTLIAPQLKLQPPEKGSLKYITQTMARKLTSKRHEWLGTIAAAPGRRFAAVARDPTTFKASLYLCGMLRGSLSSFWSAPVLDRGFLVAGAGQRKSGELSFWVGTRDFKNNRIELYDFDPDTGDRRVRAGVDVGDSVYDLATGPGGRLYAVQEQKVRIFSPDGKALGSIPYEHGFAPHVPRRAAVLADGRVLITGAKQGATISREKFGDTLRWWFDLIQVHPTGGSSAPVALRINPSAPVGIGSHVVLPDYGNKRGKRQELYAFPRSLSGTPQSSASSLLKPTTKIGPWLCLDMAWSGGTLFVLDAFKPPTKGWRSRRKRVVVYRAR